MNIKEIYIDPTQESGKEFFMRQMEGEVIMLNLLKYREVADYSAHPELAPETPISGREAYKLYMKHTLPFLEEAGGELVFYGKGGHFLIGPMDESWDTVMLVKHKSAGKFMAFAQNLGYLKGVGHRTAALEDSRLLAIEEKK